MVDLNTSQKVILSIAVFLSSAAFFRHLFYQLVAPFYALKIKKEQKPYKDISKGEVERLIRISAVVPAWNEEVGLVTSVKSLLLSDYSNMEIIVVNDGSTDNSDRFFRRFMSEELPVFAREHGLQGKIVKYFYKRNGGKGSAINYGVKNSTGDVIVTMDADTKYDTDSIYKMARHFLDPSLDAAVGNVKITNKSSLIGVVQQLEYTVGFYYKRAHTVFGSEYIIGGAFGAFRRHCFERYGYFDEKCKTEDIEYSTRLQFYGCKLRYAEDAIAYTEGPSNLSGLLKQRLRWKKGRTDTFLKYIDLFFSTKKGHKKFLTWFLLPYTLFSEFMLILEPLLFGVVTYFTIVNKTWDLWVGWLVYITFTVFIAYLFGSQKNNFKALLAAPFFYFLSLFLVLSEIYAFWGTLALYLRKRDVVWQNWQRKGVDKA